MVGWALRTFRGRGKYLMLTILRSLVQPRLDYCSQLWSPRDQGSINRLEAVQRQFLSKIRDQDLNTKNFWEKVSQGLVDGYSINFQWSDRRGRLAVPANINRKAATKVKGAKEKSLRVHGAHLFNLLPKSLRNENCKDFALFKNHLDIFLSRIPDQPTTPGLGRAAMSNSLVDQIPLVPDLELG